MMMMIMIIRIKQSMYSYTLTKESSSPFFPPDLFDFFWTSFLHSLHARDLLS